MATFPINSQEQFATTQENIESRAKVGLLDRYLNYVDSQEDQNIFWYMAAILAIPCVFMTLSIIVMYQYSNVLEYYIGFSMLLFFVNVIVHIAGMKSRVYLSIFHATGILMFLIPAVTYLISVL